MRLLWSGVVTIVVVYCSGCATLHDDRIRRDLVRQHGTGDTVVSALAGFAPDSLDLLPDRSAVYVITRDTGGAMLIVYGELDYSRTSDTVIALKRVFDDGQVREPSFDVRTIKRIIPAPKQEPYYSANSIGTAAILLLSIAVVVVAVSVALLWSSMDAAARRFESSW